MRRLVVIAIALAAAGCGGGGSGARTEEPRGGARVIRAWADDVRAGRYEQARKRFALPAVVANGHPPVRLSSPAQIDQFNRSLPCGAVLTGTQAVEGGRLVASFRLTDLAGRRGSCGSGAGNPAQVTFRVRDGRIVEWLRVGEGPPPPGSVRV